MATLTNSRSLQKRSRGIICLGIIFCAVQYLGCQADEIQQKKLSSLPANSSEGPATVGAVLPLATSVNNSIFSEIYVTFNTPVNTASTEAGFDLRDQSTNTKVSGSFTWYQQTTLVFTPNESLAYTEVYNLSVSGQTWKGKPLEPFSSSFTTSNDGVAPSLVGVSVAPAGLGAAGVIDVVPQISITFSEAMYRPSAESALKVHKVGDVTPVVGTYNWAAGANGTSILTFTPSSNLAYWTEYTVDYTGSTALDSSKRAMGTDYTYIKIFQTGNDGVVPTLNPGGSLAGPAGNGAPGVIAIDPTVTIEFNQLMNRTSTEAAFRLIRRSDNAIISGIFSWTTSGGHDFLHWSPPAGTPLDYSTIYDVTLSAIARNAAATPLGVNIVPVYSFTTGNDGVSAGYVISPTNNASGVDLSVTVSVIWSEPMNKSTAQSAFCLFNGTSCVAGSFSWSGNTMNFTPSSNLTPNTGYYPRISDQAKDSTGTSFAGLGGTTCTAPSQCSTFVTRNCTWQSVCNYCSWEETGCCGCACVYPPCNPCRPGGSGYNCSKCGSSNQCL